LKFRADIYATAQRRIVCAICLNTRARRTPTTNAARPGGTSSEFDQHMMEREAGSQPLPQKAPSSGCRIIEDCARRYFRAKAEPAEIAERGVPARRVFGDLISDNARPMESCRPQYHEGRIYQDWQQIDLGARKNSWSLPLSDVPSVECWKLIWSTQS